MSLTINSIIKNIPRLGWGSYASSSPYESTQKALAAGYRHVDTARYYDNESEVCRAVKDADLSGQVFLTTKITGSEQSRTGGTSRAVEESNARAEKHGVKWDLFLLHDPCAGKAGRLAAWKELEDKVEKGELKYIGVSNFSQIHLQELTDGGARTVPLVNQIEVHPWCQQRPIVEYCRANGIVVQAYCPLVRTRRFDDPVLKRVAEKVGKTGAQVLIRWSLQKDFVPLPKSDTPSRILENADVYDFELSEEDMADLDSLDLGAKGACDWNPVDLP
ncbi:Aldo/keto reductase [Leucosporidium creatinivorum]|uniref:Aldo/keto reductase n=1 Tax=Leucosporidium creatinivorum TaxID=106004 RepID=A0A1Y2CNJ2_9BASI|nr:Aldo/keto reductase [Leucosporidium creatinivorum]